ncbi:MAG: hypothetical protein ACXIVQ_00895 [Acidimicrobiales bacterium]
MTTLVLGAAATWGMVGVIWMVQLVQYPMLAGHPPETATAAMADHQRRISWVVGPLMAVEGVTALVLLVERPEIMGSVEAWAAATLLGIALLSTALVQVPLHSRLAEAHDIETAQRLVLTSGSARPPGRPEAGSSPPCS